MVEMWRQRGNSPPRRHCRHGHATGVRSRKSDADRPPDGIDDRVAELAAQARCIDASTGHGRTAHDIGCDRPGTVIRTMPAKSGCCSARPSLSDERPSSSIEPLSFPKRANRECSTSVDGTSRRTLSGSKPCGKSGWASLITTSVNPGWSSSVARACRRSASSATNLASCAPEELGPLGVETALPGWGERRRRRGPRRLAEQAVERPSARGIRPLERLAPAGLQVVEEPRQRGAHLVRALAHPLDRGVDRVEGDGATQGAALDVLGEPFVQLGPPLVLRGSRAQSREPRAARIQRDAHPAAHPIRSRGPERAVQGDRLLAATRQREGIVERIGEVVHLVRAPRRVPRTLEDVKDLVDGDGRPLARRAGPWPDRGAVWRSERPRA